jgi:SAM-dependent methyltransferase
MPQSPRMLYGELTSWYRLLDSPDDHEDECVQYVSVLEKAVEPAPRTLLELGAGAGNNGVWLKRKFACTLTDISAPMLALSRELNPECEHVLADMRSLRLPQTFDAVLVHDAIVYMTSQADLRAVFETAFLHLRPGGAAIFAPDCLRETFCESTELHERQAGSRALRCVEWDWDPDPSRHVAGLFTRDTWIRLIREVGFEVSTFERELDVEPGSPYTYEVFLGRRL